MPIKFNCHKCGASLRVPEKHIGKQARCPKCDEKCVVPESSQQSQSDVGLGSQFEDIGNFLDQPAAAVPMGVPPVAASPPMATPVAPPSMMPPPAVPAGVQSPYAAPMTPSRGGSGRAISGSVVQPLYDARVFIKILGWSIFILGIIQFLFGGLQTVIFIVAAISGGPRGAGAAVVGMFFAVIGFIFSFVTTWIGWQMKSAGSKLTIGVESGDNEMIRQSCQHLANYFRVLGIIAIIGVVLMAIALMLMVIGLLVSAVA